MKGASKLAAKQKRTTKKSTYVQVRVEPILKDALQEYCGLNFIDESTAIRMMIAQYPAIAEIVKQMREEEAEEVEPE